MNNLGPVPVQPQGWFSGFSWGNFLQRFDLSANTATELVSYVGVGFACGFLIKRYLRSVIILFLAMFLLIKVVEYMGVGFFIFNWDKFKDMTGIAPTDTIDGVTRVWFAWAQSHVTHVVCVVVGFIFGTKVG
ncbi:hypothetical protein JW872_03300 [Candidatus Babeliales bacterium]|nr:hypothetical protein [Candidatus Babeliales bacterium]